MKLKDFCSRIDNERKDMFKELKEELPPRIPKEITEES